MHDSHRGLGSLDAATPAASARGCRRPRDARIRANACAPRRTGARGTGAPVRRGRRARPGARHPGRGGPTAPPPDQAPGGPILVIASPGNAFTRYYAEILRAEGFNAFAVADIALVDGRDARRPRRRHPRRDAADAAQVTMFTNWVHGRRQPDRDAARQAARRPPRPRRRAAARSPTPTCWSTRRRRRVSASSIETIQFHGTADRYTLAGATRASPRSTRTRPRRRRTRR